MVIITLLTDFGLSDNYVAQMKGVIFQNSPKSEIVDITHTVPRHSIVDAAFLLETAAPYFPNDAIHLAVVDPGVGSHRLPIVVKCGTGTLVGPDNGLLHRAASKLGFGSAYEIRAKRFFAKTVSETFHGRDIFARTAALLANGISPRQLGPRISKIVALGISEPKFLGSELTGVVLHVDSFGNVITNIPNRFLSSYPSNGQTVRVVSGRKNWVGGHVRTYSDVARGKLALIMGGQGYVEIALREKSASEMLGLESLDALRVTFS